MIIALLPKTLKLLLMVAIMGAACLLGSVVRACSPAPSCWIESGPTYLRSVCEGYAKDHKTLTEIASYLDEPDDIANFASACGKLHVHFNW
jgi:hypothetical protein